MVHELADEDVDRAAAIINTSRQHGDDISAGTPADRPESTPETRAAVRDAFDEYFDEFIVTTVTAKRLAERCEYTPSQVNKALTDLFRQGDLDRMYSGDRYRYMPVDTGGGE